MAKDFLKTPEGDLLVQNGDFVVGDSTIQEIGELLVSNPGDLRDAPLIGPSLIRAVKSRINQEQIESRIGLHLKLDGKDYKEVKKYIKLNK